MATAAKTDESGSPLIAVLLLLLALAMAAGGGLGDALSGLGSGGGSQSSTKNPCPPEAGNRKLVESWRVGDKTFRLRCGNSGKKGSGYRHIVGKGRQVHEKTLDCIGKTLLRAKPIRDKRKDVYEYRHPKGRVFVIVAWKTGEVISAYLRKGSWTGCAES